MASLTLAICFHNASRFIEKTLYSVVNQTFNDFDLLLVNDCSTDDSCSIVNDFFRRYHRRYELISFDENKGICYARNFCERHASTKYMMFLDADDILCHDAIEMMYNKITSDPDLMAVGCYLEYIDENDNKIGGGIFLGDSSKHAFYERARNKKLIFMQPTAIYDRKLALSVGGYVIDGFPAGKPRFQDYCEDLDLWTRMSDLYIHNKAIVIIPKILCKYRKIDNNSLSSNHFYMIMKMRYTKNNLLRRRNGMNNITFTDFYYSLSAKQIKDIKKEAAAANSLRNAAFFFRKKRFLKSCAEMLCSLYHKPSYILEKIKANYRPFKGNFI